MPPDIALNYVFGLISVFGLFWLMIVLRNEELTDKEKLKKLVLPGSVMLLTLAGVIWSSELIGLF